MLDSASKSNRRKRGGGMKKTTRSSASFLSMVVMAIGVFLLIWLSLGFSIYYYYTIHQNDHLQPSDKNKKKKKSLNPFSSLLSRKAKHMRYHSEDGERGGGISIQRQQKPKVEHSQLSLNQIKRNKENVNYIRNGDSNSNKKNNDKNQKTATTTTTISFPPKFPIVSRSHKLDEDTLAMCDRTLWHTLETTTIVLPNNETFIHTGDIDDLWLRDSAAQIHPLLVPFGETLDGGDTEGAMVQSDPRLARIVSGLIKRTAMYIRHDPYANAFRIDDSYVFSEQQKRLGRHDLISTWNYELDSACYYIRMIYYFWKALPDHPVLKLQSVHEAIRIMLRVWTAEQHHEEDGIASGPLLDCQNCGKPYRYPGLPREGKGSPVAHTGMTWTGFRPSDDACRYGYLVPANMFAVVALGYVAELAPILWNDAEIAAQARQLANEIDDGIQKHSIVEHPTYGRIYAYEVDGLGNSSLMDDANVPSLMSIPYLGYSYDPEVYANTRKFILSPDNPTYQKGTNPATGDLEGYGSPHTNAAIRQNIWPMGLAVQGLTSSSMEEKLRMVQTLVKATGETGWMHESIDVNRPKRFTREWFCWADSLFAELVMSLTKECPRSKYKVLRWDDPVKVAGGKHAAEA